MAKALIFYGTLYGEPTRTSEYIAEAPRKEGFDLNMVNAKEDKMKDIAE